MPGEHAPLRIGHAAAVIWLRLVNACLSRTGDDKLLQVIQFFCAKGI
jgi:hypothetical protein